MLRRLLPCAVFIAPLLFAATVSAKGQPESAEQAKSAPAKPKPEEKSKAGDKRKQAKAKPAPAKRPVAKKPTTSESKRSAKVGNASKPSRSRSAQASAKTGGKARSKRNQGNPYLEVPPAAELASAPAYLYANFTNEQAYEELERRSISYRREEPGPSGVRAPIRLSGPLRGVHVHSTVAAGDRATSPFEVLDARLALALDDFCALLEQHEIVELVHYTMYRAGHSPPADSDSLPTRHPGGLAIDVGALRKRSGEWLDVGLHWKADVGAKTCGPGAKAVEGTPAQELVGLVCEAAKQRIFHYMLTPHFDGPHHDHLHLEIKPVVKWFLVN